MMNIGDIVKVLKLGQKVQRPLWNGKGMYLTLIPEHEVIGLHIQEFVAIFTVDGTLVPWQPSQTDLLAEDWEYFITE